MRIQGQTLTALSAAEVRGVGMVSTRAVEDTEMWLLDANRNPGWPTR